jgi:hypothetical protein
MVDNKVHPATVVYNYGEISATDDPAVPGKPVAVEGDYLCEVSGAQFSYYFHNVAVPTADMKFTWNWNYKEMSAQSHYWEWTNPVTGVKYGPATHTDLWTAGPFKDVTPKNNWMQYAENHNARRAYKEYTVNASGTEHSVYDVADWFPKYNTAYTGAAGQKEFLETWSDDNFDPAHAWAISFAAGNTDLGCFALGTNPTGYESGVDCTLNIIAATAEDGSRIAWPAVYIPANNKYYWADNYNTAGTDQGRTKKYVDINNDEFYTAGLVSYSGLGAEIIRLSTVTGATAPARDIDMTITVIGYDEFGHATKATLPIVLKK